MKAIKKSSLKAKKPKKQKKLTKPQLLKRREADLKKLFKECVFVRDDYKCVTCGSTERLGVGHLLPQSHLSAKYSLDNAFVQCWPCNRKHVFDRIPFIFWYIDNFGIIGLKNLYEEWRTPSPKKSLELVEKKCENLRIFLDSIEKAPVFEPC